MGTHCVGDWTRELRVPVDQVAATERTQEILQKAAAIVATGKSISEAADLLELMPSSLERLRRKHSILWGQEIERAVKAQHESPGKVVIEPLPVKVTGKPTRKTLNQIRQATAMIAAVSSQADVVKALKIRPGTIVHWQNTHQKHWEAEYDGHERSDGAPFLKHSWKCDQRSPFRRECRAAKTDESSRERNDCRTLAAHREMGPALHFFDTLPVKSAQARANWRFRLVTNGTRAKLATPAGPLWHPRGGECL